MSEEDKKINQIEEDDIYSVANSAAAEANKKAYDIYFNAYSHCDNAPNENTFREVTERIVNNAKFTILRELSDKVNRLNTEQIYGITAGEIDKTIGDYDKFVKEFANERNKLEEQRSADLENNKNSSKEEETEIGLNQAEKPTDNKKSIAEESIEEMEEERKATKDIKPNHGSTLSLSETDDTDKVTALNDLNTKIEELGIETDGLPKRTR